MMIEFAGQADDHWDAGDMGCGELVLKLNLRMRSMAPGRILRLTALDSGAKEDIPAWCAMTNHALVAATHPNYWIQRRQD
jgi:tRNA 2-thiouridine synthesizing protein A